MADPVRRSRPFAFAAGASGQDALDFLERSRDVAAEVVGEGISAETPPSPGEEFAAARAEPAV